MENSNLIILTILSIIGFSYEQGTSKELFQCRQMCYQKFVQDWHHCMDFEDCKNMCITPPNINNYIPEAFSFLCWNSCDQTLGPFELNVQSASRQGSLVLTDIVWDQAITNSSKQCLVTWEVSGGGLMGNLLTDSSTVELSLWPDTVYHVQVTCKNKQTGGMRRSYKLIVDTRKLSGTTSTIQPAVMENINHKTALPEIYSTDGLTNTNHNDDSINDDDDNRMKILKDSSKDFISNEPAIFSRKTTTTTTTSSSQSISNQINNDEEIQRVQQLNPTTILRSKLAPSSSSSSSQFSSSGSIDYYASDIFSRSILFAMMSSLVIFLIVVVAYAVIRGRRDAALMAKSIDKQGLINNEILPGSRTLHV